MGIAMVAPEVDSPSGVDLTWFDEQAKAPTKTDRFDKRSVAYTKFTKSYDNVEF